MRLTFIAKTLDQRAELLRDALLLIVLEVHFVLGQPGRLELCLRNQFVDQRVRTGFLVRVIFQKVAKSTVSLNFMQGDPRRRLTYLHLFQALVGGGNLTSRVEI